MTCFIFVDLTSITIKVKTNFEMETATDSNGGYSRKRPFSTTDTETTGGEKTYGTKRSNSSSNNGKLYFSIHGFHTFTVHFWSALPVV